jgi:hypothetical protein
MIVVIEKYFRYRLCLRVDHQTNFTRTIEEKILQVKRTLISSTQVMSDQNKILGIDPETPKGHAESGDPRLKSPGI